MRAQATCTLSTYTTTAGLAHFPVSHIEDYKENSINEEVETGGDIDGDEVQVHGGCFRQQGKQKVKSGVLTRGYRKLSRAFGNGPKPSG